MPKQTTINDAAIRAASVIIEELAHEIQNRASVLREKFDELYPNLQFADPIQDVAFDRYMIALAHAKMFCDQMPSLAYQAREMQRFGLSPIALAATGGLPDPAADLSRLSRNPAIPVPLGIPA